MAKEINRRSFLKYAALGATIYLLNKTPYSLATETIQNGTRLDVDPDDQPIPKLYTKVNKYSETSVESEITVAQINKQALSQKSFIVEGINGEDVQVDICYTDFQMGHVILIGTTKANGSVVISVNLSDNSVSGSIKTDEQSILTLSPSGNFESKIRHSLDNTPDIPDAHLSIPENQGESFGKNNYGKSTIDETVNDVYIAFTPNAENYFQANDTQMIHIAAQQTAYTNQAHLVSRSSIRYRLIGVERANYIETTNDGDALAFFLNPNDGIMDENVDRAHALGADLRLLIDYPTDQLEFCGAAYRLGSTGLNNRTFFYYAVASVHAQCTDRGMAVGHEWGHIQGFNHDIYVSQPPDQNDSISPDAYGHIGIVDTNGDGKTYRDIMSYATANPRAIQIMHFANPDVIYNGEPTGVAGVSNLARAGSISRSTVANYNRETLPNSQIELESGSTQYVIRGTGSEIVSLNGTYNPNYPPKSLMVSINYGEPFQVKFQGGRYDFQFDAKDLGDSALITVFADGYNGIVRRMEIVRANKKISGNILNNQTGKPIPGMVKVINQTGIETYNIYVDNPLGYFEAWATIGTSNVYFYPDNSNNQKYTCKDIVTSINTSTSSGVTILVPCTPQHRITMPFVPR